MLSTPGLAPDPAAAPSPSPALPPGVTPAGETKRLVSRATLHALIKQTLGVESVPPEVEELLLDVGDDFVEHCAAGAAALARHRGSDTLDASDVRLHVERVWNLPLPGHGGDDLHRAATASETQPHAARVAAIRRTLAAATHTAQQLK